MVRPSIFLIAVALLIAVTLVAGIMCGGGGSGTGIPLKKPTDFVQMNIQDIDSLDPAWACDWASMEQIQYLYDTLLFYNGNSTSDFVPLIASSWSVVNSTQIRFCIRKGIQFHSGNNLTPADVKYSIERVMVQDRDGGPAWLFYKPLLGLGGSRDETGNITLTFDKIDNAVQIEGDCVVFNFVAPYPPTIFLQILCRTCAAIVDKQWCITHGDWDGTATNWTAYNNPYESKSPLCNQDAGAGPWKLETWDPGIQVTLVRNDNYWRAPAPFERVITKIVGDWTTRKEALLHGDADLVYVPRDCIDELTKVSDLNVYKDLPELAINAFFFNMDIASDSSYIGSGTLDGSGIPTSFFSDINVRKGFSCAFDYGAYLQDAMQGDAIQPASPVIKGVAYYDPGTPKYSYDPTLAVAYLKASWNGTLWDKGFKFTLTYSAGIIASKIACDTLAKGLSTINDKFQISVVPMPFSTMLEMITGRAMPMFQMGWTFDYPDPDDTVVPFMASYGWLAHCQSYGYPEVDELIADGETMVDSAMRQPIYYQLQQIYYDDAPSIMLGQPLGRRFFTKYVHGFYFNPMIPGQAGPLYYMSKSSS